MRRPGQQPGHFVQDCGVGRLDDVEVGAGVIGRQRVRSRSSVLMVTTGVARSAGSPRNCPQELVAVHLRHVDVHDHQVERAEQGPFEPSTPLTASSTSKPALLQNVAVKHPHRDAVFDDEDPLLGLPRHRFSFDGFW